MTTLHSILAKAVKKSLVETEMTQKSLAAKVGISEKHLSLMLNGKATGSLEVWDSLLNASGVQIGWKLGQP